MPLGASQSSFLPDKKLELRAIGAPALDAAFASPPLDLVKLTPYWSTDEWGVAKELPVAIGIEAIAAAANQSYLFALEVAASEAFASPVTVASQLIAGTSALAGSQFLLGLLRETFAKLDATAEVVRLTMTPVGGDETAAIAVTDWLAETDSLTLDDGTVADQVVKIGTMQAGEIAFADVADDGDTVIIDDGSTAPVTFTFGDGTGGTVDKGVSATESAQNLKAAIAAAVLAGTLLVSATGAAATLALKNLATFSGGSITKSDVDTDYAITDWNGGVAGVATQEMLLAANPAAVYTDQVELLAAAIAALNSGDSFTATRSGPTITVTNQAAVLAGAVEGALVETQDTDDHMTVTDFALAQPSIKFWAFVRGEARPGV